MGDLSRGDQNIPLFINYNPAVVTWAPYLPLSVAACPSFGDRSGKLMTYAYNNSLTSIVSGVAVPRKNVSIRHPARVIEFICCYRAPSGGGPSNAYGTYYFQGLIAPVGGDMGKMPHSKVMNFTFLDGHGESFRLDDVVRHAASDPSASNMTWKAENISLYRLF